ncbi:MAG TPA: septum formation initiator family protein [Sphingobacteriaceae bacterium]|nr:septum formation initiator family protein [Sphingobacteriaceae bacterium]
MNRLFSIIKNRYFIAGCIFVVWMLFFDRHDISTQFDYYSQLKSLRQEKAFYESEINRISQNIVDLEESTVEIERLAREKYQMKKDGEDVFVILRQE